MGTTRPVVPGTGAGLISAFLLLGGLLAVAAGPELLAWAYGTPGMRPLLYYLLATVSLLVVGVLLVRGGHQPGHRAWVRCQTCGTPNDGHARFCNQCATPFRTRMPRGGQSEAAPPSGQEEARCPPIGKMEAHAPAGPRPSA